MTNKFKQYPFTIKEEAIEAFITISQDYEDVRLEQSVILGCEFWVVRYRFHKNKEN